MINEIMQVEMAVRYIMATDTSHLLHVNENVKRSIIEYRCRLCFNRTWNEVNVKLANLSIKSEINSLDPSFIYCEVVESEHILRMQL